MKKTYITPNTIIVNTYGEHIMAITGSVQLRRGDDKVAVGKIFDDEIDEAGSKGGSLWDDSGNTENW